MDEEVSLRNLRKLGRRFKAHAYADTAGLVNALARRTVIVTEGRVLERLRRERDLNLYGALIATRRASRLVAELQFCNFSCAGDEDGETWFAVKGVVTRYLTKKTRCRERWIRRVQPGQFIAASIVCDDSTAGAHYGFVVRHRAFSLAEAIGFLIAGVSDVEEDLRGDKLKVVKGSTAVQSSRKVTVPLAVVRS